jgi:DNA-binding IclR family transcriptional regulator
MGASPTPKRPSRSAGAKAPASSAPPANGHAGGEAAVTAPAQVAKAAKSGSERETSIRRGVEVLLSLASEESLELSGLGVTRISELLGREKSQVSRALKALNEYGLVERNKDGGYRLGWRLYALAQLAGERRLLELAEPLMRQLAHSLGERLHLSVLQGTDTMTVLSESPGRSVQTVGWAGRMTPAYCTSAGRALLVDWEDAEILAAFERVEFAAVGPRTLRSARALVKAVARARADGYAVVDEEFEPELVSVAVAVRDPRGRVIASLNASAPRYRFIDRVQDAAVELQAVADEIRRRLGDPAALELPA